jgi:hypothetical protein
MLGVHNNELWAYDGLIPDNLTGDGFLKRLVRQSQMPNCKMHA